MDQLLIILGYASLVCAIYSGIKWGSNKHKHIISEKKHGKNMLICLAVFVVCILVAGTIQGNEDANNSSDKASSSSSKVSQASSSSKTKSVSSSSTKKVAKKTISDDFVTSKQVYNNALVIVAQDGDEHNGLANSLAGFKFQQEYALTKIHDTFYKYRNNPNAKNNGIVIVSYASDDVFAVFYASPDDLSSMSELIRNNELKDFLTSGITGYYINGLYLKSVMGDDYKFLNDIELVHQEEMPDWITQTISTGEKMFN